MSYFDSCPTRFKREMNHQPNPMRLITNSLRTSRLLYWYYAIKLALST